MEVEAPPRAQWIRTDPVRAEPHRQRHPVPRRHGRAARRHHAGLLRLPRPRARPQPDRGGHRRPVPPQLRPHRRPQGRSAQGLDRRDQGGHEQDARRSATRWKTSSMGNEIFEARTRGIGVIPADVGLAYGLSGANIRASGVDWDLRRDSPVGLVYDQVDWKVWTHPDGDSFARYWVRLQETREATKIVDQLLDDLPAGPIMAKVPRIIKVPAGEAYVDTENPLGEMGYYVVIQGRPRAVPGARSARPVVQQHVDHAVVAARASTSPTSSPSWPACTSSSGTSTGDLRLAVELSPTGRRPSSSVGASCWRRSCCRRCTSSTCSCSR